MTLIVKRGETAAGLLVFAMGLVGGAFFPISVLPHWLQPVGEVVPTRFAFDGLRAALFKRHGWEGDLAILTVMGAVLLPASVLLFSGAMRSARASGALAEY